MFSNKLLKSLLIVFLLCGSSFSIITYADSPPTVVFYVAYIFEAKSNGEEITFPILPGELAISTIDNVLETTEGYIEKLRSIYAFKHFITLETISHALYLEKHGIEEKVTTIESLRENEMTTALRVSVKSLPGVDMLSARIEMHLKSKTQIADGFPLLDSTPILKTLCTVKHSHPVVIGRLLEPDDGHKRAIFIVFTPFFHRLTHASQYEEVIATYQRALRLAPGRGDLGGWHVFKKVNQYFKKKLKRENLLTLAEIVPMPPPPAFETQKEDETPVFFAYDEAPLPVGGWEELQRNLAYPSIAKKSGVSGKVVVNAEIDEKGRVGRTWILKSLAGCDQAAIEAIKKTKWKPALQKGTPVSVRVAITIVFSLH